MAEACVKLLVYLIDRDLWAWLMPDEAGVGRPCVLPAGHSGRHRTSPLPEVSTGHPNPAGPDPERDRRREAYRALQREAARKALDEWFQVVDQEAPYAVVRSAWRVFDKQLIDYAECKLQQKSHYGVSAESQG